VSTEDLAENIHRWSYGKSGSPNATCNQNPEFQAGYRNAQLYSELGDDGWIEAEYDRRGRPLRGKPWEDFSEWKRGNWAYRMSHLMAKHRT